MNSLRSYATLAQIRARQGWNAADVADDARILTKLRAASEAIDGRTVRSFQPTQEADTFDWTSPTQLLFKRRDLLSLSSVVDGAGVSIPTSSFIMQGGTQSAWNSVGPFYGFKLNPTLGLMLFTTIPDRAITVTGTWGWHTDYASAWHDSGDVVKDNPLSSSATAITVNNVIGSDTWMQSPRFSPGQLIQIDTEWMQVIGTNNAGSLSLSAQPSANDSFTINVNGSNYVYTFKTTLATAGDVLIGVTVPATILNLYYALVADSGASGTSFYAGTLAVPSSAMGFAKPADGANSISLYAVSSSSNPTLAKSGANLSVSSATLSTQINVVRGTNGTTAASHNQNATIYVYEAPKDIQDVCLRWAAYLFAQDSTDFSKTIIPQMGAMQVPAGVPQDIFTTLDRYVRRRVA